MLSSDSAVESQPVSRWSIPDVENAIKAAFFGKAAEGHFPESMRYTEIRAVIRSSRPISDRTLSKGLKNLVNRGQLREQEDGSYKRSVTWERKDRVDVIMAADKLSIDAGASVGIIGDQAAGWTFYGVPFGKPKRLRPRLHHAAMRFQDDVDETLRSEAERIVRETLSKARKRGLSATEAKGVKRILMDIFESWESLGFEHQDSFAYLFIMEKVAPGAFPGFLEKLLRPPSGVETDIKEGVPIHLSVSKRPKEWIPYLARMFMEDQEAVRADWPKLLADAKAGAAAFEKLNKNLTAKDWSTFCRHWSSIIATRYWLCAVIR